MTPTEMAALHGAAFVDPRPWSEAEIAGLLASPLCFVLERERGFLMGRVVAGEAELLTVAVHPLARRQGTGAALVAGFVAEAARRGAETAFLEVAADNRAALGLYAAAGFTQTGRRRGYYGGGVDAVLMSRAI